MPIEKHDQSLAEKLNALSDYELGRILRRSRLFRRKRRPAPGRSMAPLWTREETSLLGTRPDAELARLLGRSVIAVALRRSRLKIPHPNPAVRRWSEKEKKLLGTMPDKEIAIQLGVAEKLIRGYRERLRIPVFDRQLHRWTSAEDSQLGKERDEILAKRFAVSVSSIKHRRTRLGLFLAKKLQRPKRSQRPWTAAELAMLGKMNDREIARRTGRWVHYVRWKREELDIATPFRKRWRPEEVRLLGKLSDQEIAQRTGRSLEAVSLRRQKLKRAPTPATPQRWNAREDRLLGKAPDETVAQKLKIPVLMITSRRRFLGRPDWEGPSKTRSAHSPRRR